MQTHYEKFAPTAGLLGRGEYLARVRAAASPVFAFREILEEAARGGSYEQLMRALAATMDTILTRHGYSYGETVTDPEFDALAQTLNAILGQHRNDTVMSLVLYYHLLAHEKAHTQVYEVSPGLGEQLLHTELRGLLTDDLRLPYESVYLQVPLSLGLEVWNATTGWHRLIGLYITEDRRVGALGETPTRGWRFLLVGQAKEDATDEGDDALSHFWVPFPEGQKLDGVLDELQGRMRQDEMDGTGFGPMLERWRSIFAWVMNVMLYATWSDPGERIMANKEARQLWARIEKLPKGEKRTRLQKIFQKLDPQRRTLLGRTVTVQRHTHAEDSGTGAGESGALRAWVRTRVSGHWRNQAHGPGHTLRKLLWIAPFWRGPEDAPVSAPKHEVT